LALGRGLSSWAIGGPATMSNLDTQIQNAINQPIADDFVIDQVARLMSVRYAFLFSPPNVPGEPMLRLGNMQRFLSALLDHLERERSTQHIAEPSIA
jgi:hypothetical protein